MKKHNPFKIPALLTVSALLVYGCFEIDNVDQPEEVAANEAFTIEIDAHTKNYQDEPRYGLLGLQLPDDFEVDTVYYEAFTANDEPHASGGGYFLPNDQESLGNPAAGWADSMATAFDTKDGYSWRVFEMEEPYQSWEDPDAGDDEDNINKYEITVEARAGNTVGTYDLEYVMTDTGTEIEHDDVAYSPDHTIEVNEATSVSREDMASSFRLSQNYPNPFNPTTKINYSLDSPGEVSLEVTDITGRVVSTLVNNQQQNAGSYDVTLNMSHLSSGIYIYRLEVNGESLVRKLTLMK